DPVFHHAPIHFGYPHVRCASCCDSIARWTELIGASRKGVRYPSVLRLHQPVAIAAAGEQAILDRGLGVQFTHEEQSNHEQKKGDGNASETHCLPVGLFLLFLLFLSPSALLHTDRYLTACWGCCGKSRLRDPNDRLINAAMNEEALRHLRREKNFAALI